LGFGFELLLSCGGFGVQGFGFELFPSCGGWKCGAWSSSNAGQLYFVCFLRQVLDARDPLGTRCGHLERHLRKNARHKHLLLLLNKCDLVGAGRDRRTDGQADRQTDRQTDGRTAAPSATWWVFKG
jgi:hypothetical protein